MSVGCYWQDLQPGRPGMQEAAAAEQVAPMLRGAGGEGAVLRLRGGAPSGGGRGAVAGGAYTRASAQTGGAATRDPLAQDVFGVGAAVEVRPSARSPEAILTGGAKLMRNTTTAPLYLYS